MSAADIRKSMLLLESPLPHKHRIDEVPMSLLKTLVKMGQTLYSDTANGELQTGVAANKLFAAYQRYLGSIGKKIDQGTVGELYDWLGATSLGSSIALRAMTIGINNPNLKLLNQEDLRKVYNSVIADDAKGRLSRTMQAAIQLKNRAPESDMADAEQDAAQTQQISKKAAASAPPVAQTATGRRPKAAAPKAPAVDVKDIDAALAQLGATP